MTRARRFLTIVMAVFSLLLVASAGFAASRPDAVVHRAESESPPVPRDGDERGEDEQSDARGTEDGHHAAGADGTTVDPERADACDEAAGVALTHGGASDGTADTQDPIKLTGLDNAIAHVLANCLKNPNAPGLVNALEHLVANKAKHEAHAAAKAERKDDHTASEHDHGGTHGNPHAEGGSGNAHGGGNGNGHGHA
jgi:hypothetical protein